MDKVIEGLRQLEERCNARSDFGTLLSLVKEGFEAMTTTSVETTESSKSTRKTTSKDEKAI
ncbi:MAG: hypothetical protein ACRC2S_06570 [Waterburya sp.]